MQITCWRSSLRWRPQQPNSTTNVFIASTRSMLSKSLQSCCRSTRQPFKSRAKPILSRHSLNSNRYSKTVASLRDHLVRTYVLRTWCACSKVSCSKSHSSIQVSWSYKEKWPKSTSKSITMPSKGQGGVQYGPDGKPIDQPRRPAKKAKPKNQ